MCGLPFVLGIGLTMNHPLVKALKRDSPRGRIGKYRSRTPVSCSIENRVVRLERRPAVRHQDQGGTMSAEASHLEVSGIFPNVWIVERTLGMGFVQRAVVEHIVEDHWNAKCADFHDLCGLVLQRETQDESVRRERPRARDLQR